jgi:hypothetical protein
MKLPFSVLPTRDRQRERERERADVRFSLSSFTFHRISSPRTESCKWTTNNSERENKDYDDWCDDDDDCLSSMRVVVVVLDEREKREEKW